MKIISPEEFKLSVCPIYNRILENIFVPESLIVPSNNFHCTRLLYDSIETLENKSDDFIKILAAISAEMGDLSFYLSFPMTDDTFTLKELPRHFLLTVDELQKNSFGAIESQAELLCIKRSRVDYIFYPEPLIYSPQGLWAAFISLDNFGWLAMNRDCLDRLRKIYPEIDRELEKQLFDLLKWYNGLPYKWQYKIGDDRKVCFGWLRNMIKYMCKMDINIDENIDLIETYRGILHQQ